jgi:long-subunit fatty acid transport protein
MSLTLNPASLGAGSGTHVFVSSSSTLDHVTIDRREVDPDSGALSDGASTSSTIWSPGAAIGAYGVWSRFAVGAQVRLPSAEEMIDGGDVTAYHSMGGAHRQLGLQIGGAYRWRRVTFGASLTFTNDKLALRFARDTALESGEIGDTPGCDGGPCGFENPAAREVYRVDTSSGYHLGNTSATAGLLVQLTDAWWVGASYSIPQGVLSAVGTSGTVEVERAPRDGGGTVTGGASVRFNLPQWLRVGARGRVLRGLDVVIEGRWDRLSSFSQYDVRMYGLDLASAGVPEVYPRTRGLQDELALQAGVEQPDVGQRWVLGARLGAERGATSPGHLSPQQVYPSALTADLAVQLRIAPAWTVQLGYGVAWAPRRDTGRGANDPLDRIRCIESGYDLDTSACQATRAGYALPTASGVYGRIDNVFRAALVFTLP